MRERHRGGVEESGASEGEGETNWRGTPTGGDAAIGEDPAPARAEQRPVELWAGAECTVNRVRDRYFDQLQRTGHDARLSDLERLASLGVSRVRFPVLWERTAAHEIGPGAFDWSDVRLKRLGALGIAPIVGLVHHGSGPPHTDLCDAGFAEGLGAFAGQVARRYPWVDAYTPVNEPLTTARFAALYGLWYPHATDIGAFYRALANEVLATRASMRAIRRINPRAELYSTEDVAQVFSTPDLAEQRDYENERRWLSLDLLFGRVDARHPLRRELEIHGVEPRRLDEWCDEPCAPNLVGVNYYVTSDRFLDSRLERYPRQTYGGNGRQTYADVEAVRARPEGIVGHRAVLQGVWRRYRAPCALTEVHLAGHREDQLRWLTEAWRAVRAARSSGAEVRAVTVWSAFGAVGWNELVTRDGGQYEAGAYDVRSPAPRATALVTLARGLVRGDARGLPSARGGGWWRSNARLFPGVEHGPDDQTTRPSVLVIGAGAFARRVEEACARRFACIATPTLGTARRTLISSQSAPWAVIFAFDPAGRAPQLDAQLDQHWKHIVLRCTPEPSVLALSSERVYDGWAAEPPRESDLAIPADAEGRGWLAFERTIARSFSRALIVRSGFVMDPEQVADPLMKTLAALRRGRVPAVADDTVVSPSWTPHLVDAALDLSIDGEAGVWHLVPRAACSVLELIRRLATCAGVPFDVEATASSVHANRGPRRALASERGWPLPELEFTIEAAIEGYRRALERAAGQRSRRAAWHQEPGRSCDPSSSRTG